MSDTSGTAPADAPRPADADVAWGHFLAQHQGRLTLEALVRALYVPVGPLASALVGLRTALDLDRAEGARLDLIGSIVGVSRDIPQGVHFAFFGFAHQPAGRGFGQARMRREGEPIAAAYTAPDTEYRRMVRAKIALNNAAGTADDVTAVVMAHYGTDFAFVEDLGNAHARVWVGRIPAADDALARVAPRLPRAAGVAFEIVFYGEGGTFGFLGQQGVTGFGQGPMARRAPSNRAAV